MTAKWRTAFRAIAATLIVFALLTAIGWFGAGYFTSGNKERLYDADYYVAGFRTGMLMMAVFYGTLMLLHWLAAGIFGVDDIRSQPATWLLGIAWVLILFCYAQSAFQFDLWWLDPVCPAHGDPNGSDSLDAEFERCRMASTIVITLFVVAPLLLTVLSALIRIVSSRRSDTVAS